MTKTSKNNQLLWIVKIPINECVKKNCREKLSKTSNILEKEQNGSSAFCSSRNFSSRLYCYYASAWSHVYHCSLISMHQLDSRQTDRQTDGDLERSTDAIMANNGPSITHWSLSVSPDKQMFSHDTTLYVWLLFYPY